MVNRLELGNLMIERAAKLANDMREDVPYRAKDDGSIVTDADFATERLLRQLVDDYFEHDGFIGEEYPSKESGSGFTWETDPIDFTWGYVHGRRDWTVNLCLFKGESVKYAWVARPAEGEIIQGGKLNASARRHPVVSTRRIPGSAINRLDTDSHRQVPNLVDCRMVRVSSERYHTDTFRLENMEKDGVVPKDNLSCGSFSNVLSQMAIGRIDAFIARSRNGYKPYDVNAGIHLLESVGGRVSDPCGCPVDGRYILAARSPKLHKELLDVVAKYEFGKP